MLDTLGIVQMAFYNCLNGNLTYGGFAVGVSDEKIKSGNTNTDNYVILSNQTASPEYTKSSRDEFCTIVIDIVTKQPYSVNKVAANNIANQILTLVSSTPNTHNLVAPSPFQFLDLKKESDSYLPLQLSDTTSIMRRLMTFSLRVTYR